VSCESGQNGPVGRLQRRSMDLTSEYRHLVAQHHDLDSEVRISATGESDELEEAAEGLGRGMRGLLPDDRRVGVRASKSTSQSVDGTLGADMRDMTGL
jgi:hypothetical protein